ncbi:unnamed protein product [Darwinula stevensoni]|uniref:C2H2-type domain-containing protein n=1 Tax=Darwinula stevensoni TaxID=69355 RepID=A0A7R9A4C0_9CRUS|nr:unnamed protein product [Darwinula stevensoni]CAG0883960.1 unnamed protein product [Darwinula stevensoni]
MQNAHRSESSTPDISQNPSPSLEQDSHPSQSPEPIHVSLQSQSEGAVDIFCNGSELPTARRPLPQLIPLQGEHQEQEESHIAETTVELKEMDEHEACEKPVESCDPATSSLFDNLHSVFSSFGDTTCKQCGHESKTMSEAVMHMRTHTSGTSASHRSIFRGTRCQYCRHRCKTGQDLINHEAVCDMNKDRVMDDVETESMPEDREVAGQEFQSRPIPLIGDVFDDGEGMHRFGYFQDEKEQEYISTSEGGTQRRLRRVYQCPFCKFWASTASRFHVHMVGHLNKKPFECSICFYKSNWRWDVTKHIKIRAQRDRSHRAGCVVLTDESGIKNYNKYEKYATFIEAREGDGDTSDSRKNKDSVEGMMGMDGDSNNSSALDEVAVVDLEESDAQSDKAKGSFGTGHSCSTDVSEINQEKHTLWKCKKCDFRMKHSGKIVVIKNKPDKQSPFLGGDDYDGIQNQKGDMSQSSSQHHSDSEGSQEANPRQDSWICSFCPFAAKTTSELEAHMEKHVIRPEATYKCVFCPSFVTGKKALCHHLETHGVQNPKEFLENRLENQMKDMTVVGVHGQGELLEAQASTAGKDEKRRNGDSRKAPFPYKKWHCSACPYVTGSKTQFMYHKQFHRPRVGTLKCSQCSYNVTRRHLLHQHLKVHDMKPERYGEVDHSQEVADQDGDEEEDEEGQDEAVDDQDVLLDDENSSSLTPSSPMSRMEGDSGTEDRNDDIPLVWVSRKNKFMKMYKCRFCPHVNMRKCNIQEHEKMHSRGKLSGDVYKCKLCSYVCVNAGVMAVHMNVHRNKLGKVHRKVDLSKSDEEQIEELARNKEPSTPQKHDPKVSIGKALMFFCQSCPARFKSQRDILIHEKLHIGTREFNCHFCSYSVNQRSTLASHAKVHSEEYKQKTLLLLTVCPVSPAYPVKKEIYPDSPSGEIFQTEVNHDQDPVLIQRERAYHCSKCPARFFKWKTLRSHNALHGCDKPFKCDLCDYAVTTVGNLARHFVLHHGIERRKPIQIDPEKGDDGLEAVPFYYPLASVKGKMLVTRYRCPKCPTAVQKRDQYQIHMSLHGAKNKYTCSRCDYSVKHYANHLAHVKRHEHHDMMVRIKGKEASHGGALVKVESPNPPSPPRMDEVIEPIEEDKKDYPLTLPEKQHIMLQRIMKDSYIANDEKKYHMCAHCPYSSTKRDHLKSHELRHKTAIEDVNSIKCPHCNYNAPIHHYVKEHTKIHFRNGRKVCRPDSFLTLDKFEIWSIEQDDGRGDPEFLAKLLSGGHNHKSQPTKIFSPTEPLSAEGDEEISEAEWKYIDVKKGMMMGESSSGTSPRDEDDTEDTDCMNVSLEDREEMETADCTHSSEQPHEEG